MQVREVMTTHVETISPEDMIEKAARLMAELDCGSIPVRQDDRLVGMVTDRDIVLRAVALGKSPHKCKVRDIMSPGIKYIFEDETTDEAARNMSRAQIRRLPVMNRQKRLVGILALGDLAVKHNAPAAAEALEGISTPAAA